MPQRLLPYRTASFVGFIGIFLFAVIALARLPALGPAEAPVHGVAWIGVVAAVSWAGPGGTRAGNLRIPYAHRSFVLLVLFVSWV
jgi:hypothetical protein